MKPLLNHRAACALLCVCVITSCATAPAPGISGRWIPVNRYPQATQSIPLDPAYVFYAAPMDGTLRTLLSRWARDRGMTLDYRNPSDFTLYQRVSSLHADSLAQAVTQLSTLYAAQDVAITVRGNAITVDRASPSIGHGGTGVAPR